MQLESKRLPFAGHIELVKITLPSINFMHFPL